jgi:hypothetical protein
MTDFDFSTPMVRSGCRILVVFGIGDGSVIAEAADFPFDHIYGVEPSHHQAIVTAFKHADNQKITILHGKGARGWGQISEEISAETPVLFLFGGANAESDRQAVVATRDMTRDVILAWD